MTGEKNEKIEIPAKFKDLVKQIEEMSVMNLAELVKILEEKFGVSAAVATAAAPTVVGAPTEAGEEKQNLLLSLKMPALKKFR